MKHSIEKKKKSTKLESYTNYNVLVKREGKNMRYSFF